MRPRRLTIILVAVAVLLAGSWFGWGREGLQPVPSASTGADEIIELYAFIGFFAAAIFLSVAIPLALIIARYRAGGLPRETEGPQVHGNTRLELIWVAIPLGIVLVLTGFTLYKANRIANPPQPAGAEGELRIRVEGRQFYWRYVYPNDAIAIDRLRVPVDRLVHLEITAPDHDVNHSFWAPAIGGKMDAIPGQVNELEFRATRTGVFEGRCAELCGIQHGVMDLAVEVLSPERFGRWLEAAAPEEDDGELGTVLWAGVCAKCHLGAPEYAPNLAGNPLLGDEGAIRQIVTEGTGRMPPVGRGWSDYELRALTGYLKTMAPGESAGGG